MAMPSTGDYCDTPGQYESACCGAALEMVIATYFPSCPRMLESGGMGAVGSPWGGERLNAEGHPTRTGELWAPEKVRQIASRKGWVPAMCNSCVIVPRKPHQNRESDRTCNVRRMPENLTKQRKMEPARISRIPRYES